EEADVRFARDEGQLHERLPPTPRIPSNEQCHRPSVESLVQLWANHRRGDWHVATEPGGSRQNPGRGVATGSSGTANRHRSTSPRRTIAEDLSDGCDALPMNFAQAEPRNVWCWRMRGVHRYDTVFEASGCIRKNDGASAELAHRSAAAPPDCTKKLFS